MATEPLEFRRAAPGELAARLDEVVGLAGLALGWDPGAPNAELFRWKHMENPFGLSPAWFATSAGEIVGFRCLLRWELVGGDGRVHRAVRAVDTATHPRLARQGVFSRLTNMALDDLAGEGVDLVFNTPNDQSRPGYLKLGWVDVGRLPVVVRPRGPSGLLAMARARLPAEKWSLPSSAGTAAAVVLAEPGIGRLLAAPRSGSGLRTLHSPETLRWRYGFGPLHYRAVLVGSAVEEGVAIFRLRRRGGAIEVAVTEVFAPSADGRARRRLWSSAARAAGGSYLLGLGRPDPRAGLLPLPGQGPRLTVRKVCAEPPRHRADWCFSLGDIELL